MHYNKYDGNKIYLSSLTFDDCQLITKWLNDETLASSFGNIFYIQTESGVRMQIEENSKKGIYQFGIIRKEDNKIIGVYELQPINIYAKRFRYSGYIGEKEDRSKGYGTEALKLITKFAFEILNAETIFSSIYSFNEASLKSAEKAGYRQIGKFHNAYYYNMRYYDDIQVEIIRDDYLKIRDSYLS